MRTLIVATLVLASLTARAAAATSEPPLATPIPEVAVEPSPCPIVFPSYITRDESLPSRRGTPAYVTGLAVFGASYLPVAAYGAYSVATLGERGLTIGGLAQLPVAGPLTIGALLIDSLRLESDPTAREILRTTASLFITDAILQAAGLTLTIIGHVQRARDPRPFRRLAVGPSPIGAGLTVSGSF